jgi:transposase-like protein
MTFCALCHVELSEANYTREHIIPNAIGGRLKIADFICQSCNSTFGYLWDAELAKQLNWFSVALNCR